MRADHLTFRRATSISLVGLFIQGALALLLLTYAFFAADHAAMTGAMYTGIGLLLWLSLALVFHQHTLERLEAIETEAYESSAAGQASAFEAAADELRVAARRLAWMHRILLPILSVVIGALLIGVGIARFIPGRDVLAIDGFRAPGLVGWAIAVGLGVSVIGFIFARFVAGMAQQREWINLRAGAAYSVGAALVGLAIAIAHFVSFLGNDLLLRYLHVALPVYMMTLGAEIFVNFVLNVYRPRRAGEVPRPAFDSRILGFIAAPDRLAESLGDAISYQFGFDVTKTWFYRLLSRTVALLVLLALGLLWALSSLAIVQPNERGLVVRFGQLRAEIESGLHLKWPWPIERVETYPALAVNELQVGSPRPHTDGPILWTNPHGRAGAEVFMIVQPEAAGREGAARDFALLAVEIPIHYTVSDLTKYHMLAPAGMREELLHAVASRVVIEYIATRGVEDVLGRGRAEINSALRRLVDERFRELDAGVELLFVGIAGAHPPREEDVAKEFESAVASEMRRETLIERARADQVRRLTKVVGSVELSRSILRELDAYERMVDAGAEERAIIEQELKIEALLAEAGGEAKDMIVRARAQRWMLHMGERGRANRHAGLVASYRASPAVFRAKQYLDALRAMAGDARVYIVAHDQPRIRIDLDEIPDIGSVPTTVTPREN
ncbi:MAG: hypothetical protein EA379_08025 [Phycisphaerales bacterium]|nr:MAG: hypothetical protein EA379_08025 [Phycisphaerales bacterium]